MARQFFDFTAEERSAQRDDEILEALEAVQQSVEDVFALVFSLSLAASSATRIQK